MDQRQTINLNTVYLEDYTDIRKRKKRRRPRSKKDILQNRVRKTLRRKRRTRKKRNNSWLLPKDSEKYEIVNIPSVFSLINNTEEVLKFFKNVGNLFANRKQLHFNLEDVDELTPDAIALLVAKLKDDRFTRGLKSRGNLPKNNDLRRIIEESGFFEHVSSLYPVPRNKNNLLFHHVTAKKVDPTLAAKVGTLATRHTFKKKVKFSPIYEIMIECMSNTDNHANLKQRGYYNWWLSVYCNPKNDVTSFIFLDLGVGIFNSSPVSSYKKKILESSLPDLLLGNSNAILAPQLFTGIEYTSRTGEEKRGQGLPRIKVCSENDRIKKFVIITNNVKVELPNLKSTPLENKFNGTFLYWELHPNLNEKI
jgi:hypothetical protein